MDRIFMVPETTPGTLVAPPPGSDIVTIGEATMRGELMSITINSDRVGMGEFEIVLPENRCRCFTIEVTGSLASRYRNRFYRQQRRERDRRRLNRMRRKTARAWRLRGLSVTWAHVAGRAVK